MEESKVNWEKLVEDCYKARKEVVTNSDLENLPAFTVKMKEEELELFIDCLKNNKKEKFYFFYEPVKLYIGFQEISINKIILNIPEFTNLFDGFVDKIVCKLRYAYNKEEEKYNVKLTGYAITRPIKVENMKDLYERIFKGTNIEKNKEKFEEICGKKDELWYEDINYAIAFHGVQYLIDMINREAQCKNSSIIYGDFVDCVPSFNFKYDRTGVNECSTESHCKLSIFADFVQEYLVDEGYPYHRYFDFVKRVTGFKYSEYIDKNEVEKFNNSYYEKYVKEYGDGFYTYYEINEKFFAGMLNCKRKGKMVSIDYLQDTFKEHLYLYPVLVNNLETYIIEEEVKSFLDENNEIWYANMYKSGRLFETTLLYDGIETAMLFTQLNLLYEKVNKDYERYIKNVKLFLETCINQEKSEEKFTYGKNFFKWYASNIEPNELDNFFEAKAFKINCLDLRYYH